MVLKPAFVFVAGFVSSPVYGSQAPNCPPCSSQQAQLTQAEAQVQLDLHNSFRHAVHGSSRDLNWNCALMCQAQVVGDTCNFAHSGSYSSPIQAGENFATGDDGTTAAWMWFQEYVSFVQPQYTSGTGHYTAMVWESTSDIGCGKCSNPGSGQQTIYLCQYANAAPNFGFQGTNYYADNVPTFAGTKHDYNTGGIAGSEVRRWLGQFCNWVRYVPSFQSSCDALAAYESSPSLLEISRGKKQFRLKGSSEQKASSLLQISSEEDEHSLLQKVKPVQTVKHRHNHNAVATLLESAKGMLKNGETADVVEFAAATLTEITSVVIPAIESASAVEQELLLRQFEAFEVALVKLEQGIGEVHQLHWDQWEHNRDHLACREIEAGICDTKLPCDYDLYAFWTAFIDEESELRTIEDQIHNRVDGHFCAQDTQGNYIMNGTTHVFRERSVPIMTAFSRQWPAVIQAEVSYDLKRPQCEQLYYDLDEQTGICDDHQSNLESVACQHRQTVQQVRSEFDCDWASAMHTYDLTEKEVRLMQIDRIREFRTLSTITCLLDRTTERNGRPCDEATGEVATEIARCEEVRRDVDITWLILNFPCELRQCGDLPYGIGPHLADDGSYLSGCDGPLVCPAVPPPCGYDAEGRLTLAVLGSYEDGRCYPQPPVHPCTEGQVFSGLPLVPQPDFHSSNSHCNQRPLCEACTLPAVAECPVPDWVWAQYTEQSIRHGSAEYDAIRTQAAVTQAPVTQAPVTQDLDAERTDAESAVGCSDHCFELEPLELFESEIDLSDFSLQNSNADWSLNTGDLTYSGRLSPWQSVTLPSLDVAYSLSGDNMVAQVAWAYPDPAGTAATAEQENHFLSFLRTGGFVYLNSAGQVVAIKSLAPMQGDVRDPEAQLTLSFEQAVEVTQDQVSEACPAGMNPITLGNLYDAGARQYCWAFQHAISICDHGCFLYQLDSGYVGFAVMGAGLD